MAFDTKGLDNYIDVPQRIADFRALYPDGSLQPADPAAAYHIVRVPSGWCRKCSGARTVKMGGNWKSCPRCEGTGLRGEGEPTEDTFIVYTAAAYRTPHDTRPGIGVAWEVFPGSTPYTAGSEVMNAETSAWGRAIVAVLASDSKRGVSSREEVRNRRAEQDGDGEDEVPRNQDGSISRRRATPAQKEAAGLMSPDQQKAHNELRKGADGPLEPAEHAKLRRCSPGNPCNEADCPQCTADVDLWTDQPAAPPSLRMPRPARSLPEQIATHLSRLDITDRDVRLGITAQIAGTGRLSSSKDLTASQARQVLDVLEKCRDGAALREYLDSNQEVTSGV
jgi:hypothetical protein